MTAYDIHTGKQAWQRQWANCPRDMLFTPDVRRLVVAVPDPEQVEILNAVTGVTEQTIPLPGFSELQPRMTRDGRTLLVLGTPPEEEPHWLLAKLQVWLPDRRDTPQMLVGAFDLETGAALGELRIEDTDEVWLTEDRQSLVAIYHESLDNHVVATTLRCWDMPPHRPLRWIAGVPLALGVMLLLLRAGWRRRRRLPAPALQGAITEAAASA